jgi:hypothetical protein
MGELVGPRDGLDKWRREKSRAHIEIRILYRPVPSPGAIPNELPQLVLSYLFKYHFKIK